jgi:hypothetical protein
MPATLGASLSSDRDALCDRIGRSVTDGWVREGEEIRICFGDGSSVRISLRPEDYSGPEAAEFIRGSAWSVW